MSEATAEAIAAWANTIRKNQTALLRSWGQQRLNQQQELLQKIQRSAEGEALIAERNSLDAEYQRKIKPIEDRWTTLKGLHVEDGKEICDGSELTNAQLVVNEFYSRRYGWQDRWNALVEVHRTPANVYADTTLASDPDSAAPPDWKTRSEAARIFRVHPSTVKTWIEKWPEVAESPARGSRVNVAALRPRAEAMRASQRRDEEIRNRAASAVNVDARQAAAQLG